MTVTGEPSGALSVAVGAGFVPSTCIGRSTVSALARTVLAPESASQPIASSESEPEGGRATSVGSVVPVNDCSVSRPSDRCRSRSWSCPLASIEGIVGPAKGVATVRTPDPFIAFESESRNPAALAAPSVPLGTTVPSVKV